MMDYFQTNEHPTFRMPNIKMLHLAWYAVGLLAFLASYLFGKKYPHLCTSIFFTLGVGIIGAAYLFGQRHHDLPYLHIGSMHINAAEAGAIAFLIPLGSISILSYILPAAFCLIGSDNAALCMSMAVFALSRIERKTWLAIYSIILSLFIVLKNVNLEWSRHGLVLYDFAADANGHTEFILSHIAEHMGLPVAIGCVIVIFLIFGQYLRLASNQRSLIAFSVYFITQTIFNVLVATNLLKNPSSGVFLPFLSFGGSQIVFLMAVLGTLSKLKCENRLIYLR